jgi:hypothetical protein
MTRTILIPLFAVGCLTLSAGSASAQSLLNPMSWFAPQPAYGARYSNYPAYCPHGKCFPQGVYQANCVNGYCPPTNCPNGICPTPVGQYGVPQNYGPNYGPNYGTAPSYGTMPNYNGAPLYGAPRQPVPTQYQQYQPYSAQRPVMQPTMPSRNVTPAGYNQYAPSVGSSPRYAPNNSPFYP